MTVLALLPLSKAEDKTLENFLPGDATIVATLNDVEGVVNVFRNSKLFEILATIHRHEHPNKPALPEEFAKLMQHPFFHIIKTKLALSVNAPKTASEQTKETQEQPVFVLFGSGTSDVTTQLENFLQQEEKAQKLYRLPDQEYGGHKVIVSIHPDKGKVQQHYTLLTDGLFIISNRLESLHESYDRLLGKRSDGWQTPEVYKALGQKCVAKICVNISQLPVDLSKQNPLEQKFPEMKAFFDEIRSTIAGSQRIVAGLSLENGVRVQVVRERNSDAPKIFSDAAAVSFAQSAIDANTIAFAATPLPYQVFWYGFKADVMHKDKRKLREIEARLNELFDWVSFEKDVVTVIGPKTALWLQMPQKRHKEVVVPNVHLLLNLSPGVDFNMAIEKLWKLASQQKSDLQRYVKRNTTNVDGVQVHQLQFKNHPIEHLLSPTYAFTPNWLLLSSQPEGLKSMHAVLKDSQSPKVASLYCYVNFSKVAELIEANIPFFKKEAQKKGEKFEEPKMKTLLEILSYLQTFTMELREEGNLEIMEASLLMTK
jgi:hypothetical protein